MRPETAAPAGAMREASTSRRSSGTTGPTGGSPRGSGTRTTGPTAAPALAGVPGSVAVSVLVMEPLPAVWGSVSLCEVLWVCVALRRTYDDNPLTVHR
ncbi:hypothetical protein Acsp07_03650 [Actinomycetospora sp. NBRC 106378]|nr:hypothetical protein Acsp07_03650 [Actinomycetospora sp. NBRC 106378]